MEALSIALVLIFTMWLIEKHSAWKTAGTVALIVLGLAVLSIGSFYGWNRYQDWKREEAERRKHAELVSFALSPLNLVLHGTHIAYDGLRSHRIALYGAASVSSTSGPRHL